MLKGTIIENSLNNKEILKKLQIDKTWRDGDWIFHAVQIQKNKIPELQKSLNDGPWYIHLWKTGKYDVRVIFKNKTFTIKSSDKSTWTDAINYGRSLKIPLDQLDFLIY
ncbi:MAG: hypothetical protein AAB513_03295 [Patescibacteria group bacterium]